MKHRKQERGFSLIELMVAASVTIGLTGIVFYYLRTAQNSFVTESSVGDMNQNFRAAADLISRDIQAAGAGIPLFLGPIMGKDTSGNDSDRILLLYGNSAVQPTSVLPATGTTPLPTTSSSYIYTATPATAYQTGIPYVLFTTSQRADNSTDVSDYAEFYIFTLASSSAITNVTGGVRLTPTAWALDPSSATTWNHCYAFPSSGALKVVPLDEMIEYKVDLANKVLQRNRSNGGWVNVARGITNLNFQYLIETYNSATSTYSSTWYDQPAHSATNNSALIRSVRFTLAGQTQMLLDTDRQGQRKISQTIEIAPRNMVLPGWIPNR